MITRTKEIDNFIKYVANYINKNDKASSDTVYAFLQNYGYQASELGDTTPLFNNWINRYSNNPNIQVYHDERQRKFLQFNTGFNTQAKHVKLYLSIPLDKMETCVNLIFDYIANNHMLHSSKVANKTRSDSVVLRLDNIEDAEKVINFINNNEYIKSCAKPTNPFLNRAGVVGVAYDDRLSYNDLVSEIVYAYIKSKKGLIKNYKTDDFLSFAMDYYNKIFVDKTYYEAFTQSNYFLGHINRLSQDDSIENVYQYVFNNAKEVFEVLLTNLNTDNYKDVYKIINKSKGNNIDKKELLDSYIRYAYTKYLDIDSIIKALTLYINGTPNSITRDNNYRELFEDNLSREDINSIIKGYPNDYIESVLGLSYSDTEVIKESHDEDLRMFILGCKRTYQKHGYDQLRLAINEFVKGNIQPMSNDQDNCRTYFKNKYSPEELTVIMKMCISSIMGSRTEYLDIPIGDQIANILINEYDLESNSRAI